MSNIFKKPSVKEFNEWKAHKLVENFMDLECIEFYRSMTYNDYCIIKKSEFVERNPDY